MKNGRGLRNTNSALLALVNAVYYVQNDVKNRALSKRLERAMRGAELTLQANRERRIRGAYKPRQS
jgi:hypothetical protein